MERADGAWHGGSVASITILMSFVFKTLIQCWGMRDFCFSPKFLEAWKDRWPHMMVHEMHHAGHYVLEDSYEECEARMKPFLLE